MSERGQGHDFLFGSGRIWIHERLSRKDTHVAHEDISVEASHKRGLAHAPRPQHHHSLHLHRRRPGPAPASAAPPPAAAVAAPSEVFLPAGLFGRVSE